MVFDFIDGSPFPDINIEEERSTQIHVLQISRYPESKYTAATQKFIVHEQVGREFVLSR